MTYINQTNNEITNLSLLYFESKSAVQTKLSYLEICQNIVGSKYIITNNAEISAVETATFATSQRVNFVIQPGSTQEVKEIVLAARNFDVHLYPISRGYNWGYGSKVPNEIFSVIVDLSRLDSIKVDEKNATVTLGPGVSQQQLFEYLRSHHPHLLFSLTGSSPDSSVIGNALDAGYANGLNSIRWNHVISVEAILPSGELLQTGFESLANASTARISRYGLGPDLKGLFRQSSLGIVTEMSLELSVLPEYLQIFYFSIDEEEQLGELIEQLQYLKLNRLIESNWILLHGYRILAELTQFPWSETDSFATLDRDLMLKLLKQQQIPVWEGVYNGVFAVYSPSLRHCQASVVDLQEALNKKVSRLKSVTVDRTQIKRLRWNPQSIIPGLTNELLKGRLLTFAGIPRQGSIPMAYWRKPCPIPEVMDLDRDRCGFIWQAITAPASGQDALTIVPVIEHFFNDYGFEPMIVLDGVSSREMYVMTSLVYDRTREEQDRLARECFQALSTELRTMGYYPYRWPKPLAAASFLRERHDDYLSIFNKLQSSFL